MLPWLLLVFLFVLGCGSRTRSPAEMPAPVAPAAVSQLTWKYLHAAPDQFVIQRRLEGQAWEDLATLPGASGTEMTWRDTSLAPGDTALVVHYQVYALKDGQRSLTTNRVTTTIPPVSPVPPTPVGTACTVTGITATAVTITCPLVAPTPQHH